MLPTTLLLLHSLRSKGYTAKTETHVTSATGLLVTSHQHCVAPKQQGMHRCYSAILYNYLIILNYYVFD